MKIGEVVGVLAPVAGAVDVLRGIMTYTNDRTMQDPELYARQDAIHAMLPWTQAPSLTEAFAQAPATPDVATAQPIVEVLANFVHSPTQLITAAVLIALGVGGAIFATKFSGDIRRAANDIDTTIRRRNPLA